MSIHRRNPRRDTNERGIIDALEQIGCTVAQLSAKGIPDLLVGYRGKNLLIEVKCEKGKLTEDQIERHASWMGEIHIARTADEAIKIVTAPQ